MPQIPQISGPVTGGKTLTSGNNNTPQNTEPFSINGVNAVQRPAAVGQKGDASGPANQGVGEQSALPPGLQAAKDPSMAVETLHEVFSGELLENAKLNGYTELVGEIDDLTKAIYIDPDKLMDEIMTQEKDNTVFAGNQLFEILRELCAESGEDTKDLIANLLKTLNYAMSRGEILDAVKSNIKFLAEYFGQNTSLSKSLYQLYDKWNTGNPARNFESLKNETAALMRSIAGSLQNDSRTETLVPLVTHNLSRYNTNEYMMKEAFTQLMSQVPKASMREGLSKAFTDFVTKLLRENTNSYNNNTTNSAENQVLKENFDVSAEKAAILVYLSKLLKGLESGSEGNLPAEEISRDDINDEVLLNAFRWESEEDMEDIPERPLDGRSADGSEVDRSGRGSEVEGDSKGLGIDRGDRGSEVDRGNRGLEADRGGRGSEIERDSRGSEVDRSGRGSEIERDSRGSEVDRGGRGLEADRSGRSSELGRSGRGLETDSSSRDSEIDRSGRSSSAYRNLVQLSESRIAFTLNNFNSGLISGRDAIGRLLSLLIPRADTDAADMMQTVVKNTGSITEMVNFLNRVLENIPDIPERQTLCDAFEAIVNKMAQEHEMPAEKSSGYESETVKALTAFIEKNVNHPAIRGIDNFNASNLLQSILNAPGVFTPLAHYIIPLQVEDTRAFGELWVDNDNTSKKSVSGEKSYHLFLTFDVEAVGRFEVDAYSTGKELNLSVLYPKSYRYRVPALTDKITKIAAGVGFNVQNFKTGILIKPHSLAETFPRITENRRSFDVKA